MGVSFTYVSKIEKGKAPPPKRDRIEEASGYLALSEEEEIDLMLLADKVPADVQKWVLNQPDAVRLYRSIQKAPRKKQERILADLIKQVEQQLGKRKE